MDKKKTYIKPSVKKKKIVLNQFFGGRYMNGTNRLSHPQIFAASTPPCFKENTRILLENGKLKSIQDINVHDKILSYDEINSKVIVGEVEKLLIHENYTGEIYVINDKLWITPEHVIYINEEWRAVHLIKEKDELLRNSGEREIVKTIKKEYVNDITVYNLHIKQTPYYFAENILVHNAKVPCDPASCSNGICASSSSTA